MERRQRGALTDATLEFINRCFSDDVVVANRQRLLFKPRPPKPPILVGGGPQYALKRAATWGDGWLPMANNPEKLAPAIAQYRALTERLGKPAGQVTVMARLPMQDPGRTAQTLAQFEQLGVDRVVCAIRYASIDEYEEEFNLIAQLIEK